MLIIKLIVYNIFSRYVSVSSRCCCGFKGLHLNIISRNLVSLLLIIGLICIQNIQIVDVFLIDMKIIKTVQDLSSMLEVYRNENKTIGLVPTMGALHEGHKSLVTKCASDCDVTVVSVFVNPTQFNNAADLDTYPRTFEADMELLELSGATVAFYPSVEEMYPIKDTRTFDYSPLDTVMEGVYRPGHFNGVCQVVSKLFAMVNPNFAYFGEKDFQQLAIIRRMAKDLFPKLTIVGCPILRETDGLALSSRNMRLTAEQRVHALTISKTLFASVEYSKNNSLKDTLIFVEKEIKADSALELEYFEVVDGVTLQPVHKWEDSNYIVGCITVYCGDVRLIDNMTYRK